MAAFDDDITAYYDRGEEAGRLGDWGRLEMVRTQVLLERYLPAPPAVVLDVGGGPGAYAVWLAGLGYEVELVDPVELRGIGAWLADVDDWLDDPARRAALLRSIARVETEPSLLGASPHLLAVGVKR